MPKSHSLRVIREPASDALAALAGEFSALYASTGRPFIPPEKLLRRIRLTPSFKDSGRMVRDCKRGGHSGEMSRNGVRNRADCYPEENRRSVLIL